MRESELSDVQFQAFTDALAIIDAVQAENSNLKDRLGEALVRENNLIAENGRLRAALKVIAGHDGPDTSYVWFDEPRSREIARAALNEETK